MAHFPKIQIKRSSRSLDDPILNSHKLDYGEPMYLSNGDLFTVGDINPTNPLSAEKFVRLAPSAIAQKSLYYSNISQNHNTIIDATGQNIKFSGDDMYYDYTSSETVNAAIARSFTNVDAKVAKTENNTAPRVYLLGTTLTSTVPDAGFKYNTGVYVDCSKGAGAGVLMGGAWNDFAEFRKCNAGPGTVVCETGKGDLLPSGERLQAGASVVSDTFGIVIGKQEKGMAPIAVAGRVLVRYVGPESDYKPGQAVAAGPFGRIVPMTRDEIKEYPDRILGYVSEFPDYEEWNGIKVENRMWIRLK